jgi:hypothetical protein
MGFLSGTKNESVVSGQRKRVGGEFVQRRIFEVELRLNFAAVLLLAENVANVIGSEGARSMSFRNGRRDGFRTIFTNEFEYLADLAGQRTVRIGKAFEISLRDRAEQSDQTLLFRRPAGRGHLREQFLLKPFGAECLPALP